MSRVPSYQVSGWNVGGRNSKLLGNSSGGGSPGGYVERIPSPLRDLIG